MPVTDIEAHPITRRASDAPYGCHNRGEFSRGYWVRVREYGAHGVFAMVLKFIPHTMSTACRQFSLWDTDPRCAACTARKDLEHAAKWR